MMMKLLKIVSAQAGAKLLSKIAGAFRCHDPVESQLTLRRQGRIFTLA